MLIGSHFLEELEGDMSTVNNRFHESMHHLYTQRIAQQIELLFSHDEVRATCSYSNNE